MLMSKNAVNCVDVKITSDELAILSTAIAIIQKDAERRRGFVICADGKLRRFPKEQAVDLIDRMGQLAGHTPGLLKQQGLELAREVRR